jgi:serine/threonine protein kinase
MRSQDKPAAKSPAMQLQDALRDYWVGKMLGSGARSQIYEVQRKRDGQPFVAKFVTVRTGDDLRVVGHLENEYRVLAALHAEKTRSGALDAIVRPVEFEKIKGLLKVRGAYLIMERAVGQSLFEHRDYELGAVLGIFRQVCTALEHMHHVGFVHADLKPQNILVDEGLKVKLIDFGFAAPIGMALGSYKGTFGYLAPEQAGGRLTEQTDVFNLGAALYWVLTGQNLPSILPGEHEARGYVPDQQVSITPPSNVNPAVPQELSDMVLRCCLPNEHERPTVRELKQYLHGLQLRLDYGAVPG